METIKIVFPKQLKKLFGVIRKAGGQCRLIGGCVRDYLCNKTPTDFDVVTDVLPEKIIEIFKQHNCKVIPIGLEHGTVLVVIDGCGFEITTLRKDVQCFGRHAKVEFTNDWKADASRRDFTINTLSMDPEGEVYDYFGGQKDLQHGVVKFVGEPSERINEDYLRIMRFFRFLGYFGLTCIDDASYNAAIGGISNLVYISKERIKRELFKLLSAKYGLEVISMLNNAHVLQYIGFPQGIVLPQSMGHITFQEMEPLTNLAIIIAITGAEKPQHLDELRQSILLSNKEYKELVCLSAFDHTQKFRDFHHYKYWYEYGQELYLKFLFVVNNIKELPNYMLYRDEVLNEKIEKFPLTGTDLKKLGYSGEKIGELLNIAKIYWHEHKNKVTKNDLLDHIVKTI
ncbi:CCA tRNA nucleotidyltransferase [Candidatus Bandiella euplotis]|uniref:CCA-adding enzyme n=1 Tax=Candidatus Bandiella euplotis TaxID=1664265 RepID=A0ABZ0ULN7_9RICK|nr:CCA tRNA nucleotidyltransferase [Candidatus Bandiella woodruffii]WPX96649.1 CCA-adding enzyme [Candidatus Bandiella woodruffii]